MPKITPGNRLYFYQLFQREIGTGKQERVARFEEVLEADGVSAQDCDCEDTSQLLENLGEFVKLTVFKKGRVFATLMANADLDAALAKAARPAGDSSAKSGKSWKKKKSGKVPKPAKPHHKEGRKARRDEEAQGSASPKTETQPGPAKDMPVPQGKSMARDPAREPATAAPEPAATAEEPAIRAEEVRPHAQEKCVEAPMAGIKLTITYDPRGMEPEAPREGLAPAASDATVADKAPAPAQEADGQTGPSPSGPAAAAPQDLTAKEAVASGASAPEPTENRFEPIAGLGTVPPIEEPIANQAGFPQSIERDVHCKDAVLGLLYQMLPLDADPIKTMDEDWLVARSTTKLRGSRSEVTFPLHFLHAQDGSPIEVTIAHAARSASGKRWELTQVDGHDGSDAPQPPAREPIREAAWPWRDLFGRGCGQEVDPERKLQSMLQVGPWEKCLKALAEVCAPERWDIQEGDRAILRSHLVANALLAFAQDKLVASADETFASFDTGLVSPLGMPVYALLTRRPVKPFWRLESFGTTDTASVSQRLSALEALPQHVSYPQRLEDLVLRADASVDYNASKLLEAALRVDASLAERGLDETALSAAVEASLARARSSWRLAAATRNPAGDQSAFLLPLCPFGGTRTELALVVAPKGGDYVAGGVVSLAAARAAARPYCADLPGWLEATPTR